VLASSSQLHRSSQYPQVAVERTKPSGRILGIDIIPAQPPKGVSTIQGNFLSRGVQEEVKRFLSDPDRGRPKQQLFDIHAEHAEQGHATTTILGEGAQSYMDLERHANDAAISERFTMHRKKDRKNEPDKMVDVVLSDMSAPWEQTTGFWKRSLSDPYIRMMNTTGINFRDHAGSMVSLYSPIKIVGSGLKGRELSAYIRIYVMLRCNLSAIHFESVAILCASSTREPRIRSSRGS
jgi:23S rRNA U2552 (ribose-2'-O)-methylase RlmE/FtsJ